MKDPRLSAAAAALLVLVLASPARSAEAVPCPRDGRPFLDVSTTVEPPDRIIADALVAHLRAETSARGIDICPAPARLSPLGRVTLHVKRSEAGAIVALIGVEDALLNKIVTREIDLAALPDDVRPSTVAAAADELLRAAWAELALTDAPRPTSAPPKEVLEALRASFRAPSETPGPGRLEIGVGAVATIGKQRAAFGAGLGGHGWITPRIGVVTRFEATRGLEASTTLGTARIDALSWSLGPALSLLGPRERSGLRGELAIRGTLASLEAAANPGAEASRGSATTLELGAALVAVLRTRPIGLTGSLSVGYPLRPVRALDEERVATAIEGFTAGAAIGGLWGL